MPASFLDEFQKLCEGTEVPPLFAKWTAIAALSAAVGRKVAIPRGHFVLYPNLFIVLVAGSGGRKSVSLRMMQDILMEMRNQPNLTSQKESPESLIEELQMAQVNPETGALTDSCTGFGVYSELVNFLNRKTYEAGMGGLVCDLYDCKRKFVYRTKARGKEEIKNGWFGFIGAATPEGLRENLPDGVIGGGLTSRMLFVYSNDLPAPVAFPADKSDSTMALVALLDERAALSGTATITEAGIEVFKGIYDDFYTDSGFRHIPDLKGYWSRRGDHLIKLALLLAIDREGQLVIDAHHLTEADTLLREIEAQMPQVLQLIASNERGGILEMVQRIITDAGSVRHSDLMRRVSHKLDAEELRKVLQTLVDSGLIRQTTNGRATVYHWNEE